MGLSEYKIEIDKPNAFLEGSFIISWYGHLSSIDYITGVDTENLCRMPSKINKKIDKELDLRIDDDKILYTTVSSTK